MTANSSVSVALIISVGSLVVALLGLIMNARKQQKEDIAYKEKALEAENERQLKLTENFVKVNLKLDTFCDTTTRLMAQLEKDHEIVEELSKQMILCSERVETLFKYKDNHEKRITDLEAKVK